MIFQPTEDQRRAIETTAGDIFIAAGAGSGKTAVLARRFGRAVEEGAAVGGVLAITFTRKAAGEVAERVRRVLRYETGRPEEALAVQHAWISTIHGFCSRVLRRHSLEAGVPVGFAVLDAAEAVLLQEEAFERAAGGFADAPELRSLIGRFGAEDTRALVLKLSAKLRSLGVRPQNLPEVPVQSFDRALERAVAAVRLAIDVHPGTPKNATQEKNLRALTRAAELLSRLDAVPVDLRAEAALETSKECTLSARCPATKEAVVAARDEVANVVSAARDREASRYARALRELLVEFGAQYADIKIEAGVLDQDDLQEAVARLFQTRPDIAEEYASRFRMLMVDEFQDTNELQLGVIQPLRRDDLCVVGDERQAIYSFRDADVEVFRRVRATMDRSVSLDTNFRSHAEVLAFINAVFSDPALFGEGYAPLLPGHSPDAEEPRFPRAEVLLVDREGWEGRRWREAEARALADRLRELVDAGLASPGEIVVLLRGMTHSGTYLQALERVGLAATVAGGSAFTSQPEVVQLQALLAVAAFPRDESSLITLLLGDIVGLNAETLLTLRQHSEEPGGLWDALVEAAEGRLPLPVDELQRVRAAAEAVHVVARDGHRRGLGEALLAACRTLAAEERLAGQGAGGARAWGNVRKLIRIADAYGVEKTQDPGAFVTHLQALARVGKIAQAPSATEDAVRLMTIHSAKGLEFPVVAVADLGAQLHEPDDDAFVAVRDGGLTWSLRVPDSRIGEPGHKPEAWIAMREAERERQHDEAKRLLYVACTRAERMLLLSGASALEKAESRTAMEWVRGALGLTPHVGDPGERMTAEARWVLRVVTPGADGVLPESVWIEESHVDPVAQLPQRPPVPVAAPGNLDEGAGGPGALSFTALATLQSCKYRFYVERILGLKTAGEALGDSSLAFGQALHTVLERGVGDIAEDRLAAIARAHGLKRADEISRLAHAVETFRASDVAARAMMGERVAREVAFMLPLGSTRLAGAMDLVSWSGNDVLVVDYKTGSDAGRGRALAAEYELQAECYALALLEAGARSVEVAFVAVEREAAFSSITFDAEAAGRLRRKLEQLAEDACEGPYPPRADHDPAACGGCSMRDSLCEISRKPNRSPGDAA